MKKMANVLSRRNFLKGSTALLAFPVLQKNEAAFINTVTGKIPVTELNSCLIHEHILVDFIGADKISTDRWDHAEVIKAVLPHLNEARNHGTRTLFECTPAFLGRDVRLLRKLSELSGLQIVTNTGYYGASDNKYLPKWAFTETAEQLAARWILEFENGIDGTDIKPGFIKIGVNSGPLSEIHQKLITAAALTHLKTGLTICSHTGPAIPAKQQIEILQKMSVHPNAFVWVHANGTREEMLETAKSGCWISLDNVKKDNVFELAKLIVYLESKGMLGQVLVSHDAGWYKPGEPHGGDFRNYLDIFNYLLPVLKGYDFGDDKVKTLLYENPAKAFGISIRKS